MPAGKHPLRPAPTPAHRPDLGDDRLGLIGPLAVVDRDVGPARASSRAQPRPIPLAAPVTKAFLPSSFMIDALLSMSSSIVSLPFPSNRITAAISAGKPLAAVSRMGETAVPEWERRLFGAGLQTPPYTGPKWAELNAVKASGKLLANGDFRFTGTNQGKITMAPAVYVWGLDGNGNLPTGPFAGRPNIKFDAVVIVRLDSSLTPTAQVVDLVSERDDRPSRGVGPDQGSHGHGPGPREPAPLDGPGPVAVPLQDWPEDGGPPVSSSVASFAPEFTTAAGRDGAAPP